MPPHRCLVSEEPEDVVRESIGEGVEIRQIDVAEVVNHRAILVTRPGWVKNGNRGA